MIKDIAYRILKVKNKYLEESPEIRGFTFAVFFREKDHTFESFTCHLPANAM